MEKHLALVKSANLEFLDRRILNVNADVRYEEVFNQNVLNIVLDTWSEEKGERVGTAEGMTFLIALLDFFGVNNLTEVKDQYVYVLTESGKSVLNRKVLGLEHLATNPNRQCGRSKSIYSDFFGEVE